MVTINSKNTFKALAICLGFFSLSSCKEHSITKGGIADVDNINTFALGTSDFSFTFNNGITDSVVTSNFAYSYNGEVSSQTALIIGAYTDPFYGKTTASAHFQLTPYSGAFKFPDNSQIDSAVLVLPFETGAARGKVYGDTLSTLQWNIYKNADPLSKSEVYYSNSNMGLGTQIGTATFDYNDFKVGTKQIIAATNDTTSGQLRIKLNQSFAQEIFNADTNVFKNTTAFYEYFNGLSIVPSSSSTQNLLSYFMIPTDNALNANPKSLDGLRIEFHYHTAEGNSFNSILLRTAVGAYFSQIKNNYTGFPAQSYLNTNSDSILIQNIPGFRTDITINGLDAIPLSVINKAELIITAQPTHSGSTLLEYFNAPNLLIPVIVTETGKEIPLYERVDNNGVAYGSGIYMVDPYSKKVTIDGAEYFQYKINIPRSIQQSVIERKDKIKIRLKGSNYNPGMNRLIGKGVTDVNNNTRFQFNVIYTKR